MKPSKYNFIFSIGDNVRIKPLSLKGKVSGIFIGKSGIEYRIRYFFENKSNEIYFEPEDLELIEIENLPLGFNKKTND